MKIAIFIDSLAIGGAQKHVRQLACGLAAEGHRVTVFALNEIVEPLYRDPMATAGVTVKAVGRTGVLSGVGLIRTVWELLSADFDCVVTVLFVSTIFGRIAAQLAGGLPVLTCLQARNINYAAWQKLLLRATAPLTAFTASNSRSALPWAAQHEGVDLARSAFIPNAMDPPQPPGRIPSWTELGLPQLEGKRVIGSLGRLDRQKGYDILLEALALLSPDERAPLAVVVFGEGPERGNLEHQRRTLGLDGMVFFPGQRSDAAELLPKFDLYVQPSRFEGTPNAVVEALAAGVPAVSSAVDGASELAGVDGLSLVPIEDCPGWAAALEQPGRRNECWAVQAEEASNAWTSVSALASRYTQVIPLPAEKNH